MVGVGGPAWPLLVGMLATAVDPAVGSYLVVWCLQLLQCRGNKLWWQVVRFAVLGSCSRPDGGKGCSQYPVRPKEVSIGSVAGWYNGPYNVLIPCSS